MNNSLKRSFIIIAAMIILLTGTLIFFILTEKKAPEMNTDVVDKSIIFINKTTADIKNIKVKNNYSGTFNVVPKETNHNEATVPELLAISPDIKFDSIKCADILSQGALFRTVDTIAENATDEELSSFGLLEPISEVVIDYIDGSQFTVRIGILSRNNIYRYISVGEDKNTVYIVSAYSVQDFLRPSLELVDTNILPTFSATDYSLYPINISVYKYNSEKDSVIIDKYIDLYNVFEGEDEAETLSYRLRYPYYLPLGTKIFDSITELYSVVPVKVAGFVKDFELTKPEYTILFKTTENDDSIKETKISFYNVTDVEVWDSTTSRIETRQLRYAVFSQFPDLVYAVEPEIPLTNIRLLEYIEKSIPKPYLINLNSFSVLYGSKDLDFKISSSDETVTASLNGSEISSDKLTNLFSYLITMTFSSPLENLSDMNTSDDNMIFSLDYDYKNPEIPLKKIVFYNYNDIYDLAVVYEDFENYNEGDSSSSDNNTLETEIKLPDKISYYLCDVDFSKGLSERISDF